MTMQTKRVRHEIAEAAVLMGFSLGASAAVAALVALLVAIA